MIPIPVISCLISYLYYLQHFTPASLPIHFLTFPFQLITFYPCQNFSNMIQSDSFHKCNLPYSQP